MATDPYAAPHALLFEHAPTLSAHDAAMTRDATMSHEWGLRAIGVACLVFGGVLLAWGAMTSSELLAFARREHTAGNLAEMATFSAIVLGAGVLGLTGAWGYFRLQPWVRWVAIPIALGAFVVSMGLATPVVLYAAWLTWARAGRTILSPGFAAILARAPGRPQVWQLGHAIVMVVMVALYVAAFYGVLQMDTGDD